MARSYNTHDVDKFGAVLLDTGDLDPVYVVLWHAGMTPPRLAKWLIAYWCFYHVGVASKLCESARFYDDLIEWTRGTVHPRGSERRHFRGEAALKATRSLRKAHRTPLQVIGDLGGGSTPEELRIVMERVQKLRGFGPWIAFKVADMLERLGLANIVFQVSDVFAMFDAPRKGAHLVSQHYNGPSDDSVYEWAYHQLIECLGDYYAPPRYERQINIQEVETVLCKWKSHLSGHYPIGNDIKEVKHGLELKQYRCDTTELLLSAGQTGELW